MIIVPPSLTVAYDAGGYAVSVFDGDKRLWTGKEEYLLDYLAGLLGIKIVSGKILFTKPEWEWEDTVNSLAELKDAE